MERKIVVISQMKEIVGRPSNLWEYSVKSYRGFIFFETKKKRSPGILFYFIF
jgi:hypothetical protein